ncbi:MAG: hypothetical protein JSV30_07335 [Candidatus Omnitrophota bacterium]|nr:MAG: hypothetical protein JSV30_07335 [Candidatus Omnitrophota bacterium]
MLNAALYVFDRMPNVRRLIRYSDEKNIDKIFLCPVTANQDTTSLIVKHFSSIKNRKIEVIPYLEHFNRQAFLERDNFIHFISEFGEKPRFGEINFKKYFKYPFSSFSVWWSSLIFEKNPLKSDVYHSLVQLLTILKLKKEYKCKQLILDIGSKDLSCTIMQDSINRQYHCIDFKKYRVHSQIVTFSVNFLKGIKHYFYFIYKIFIVTVHARGLGFRKEILRNARYLAISYFPLIDRESLKQEKFVNKYYGALQTALENKYKDRFIWLAVSPGIDGFSFRDSVKLGRQINTWKYPIYFLEEWVSPKDLLVIMAHYVYFMIKCIIKVPYLSKSFEYSKESINVWNIFKQDWFSSFAGGALMSNIFYFKAFRNISNKLKSGTVVTYLAESQPWERTLNFTLHDQNRNLKTVGIVHTTIPLLLLQFFDSKDDLQWDERSKFTMPKPDYLACNGRIPLEVFQETGWSKKRAFLWFAIRYQHLKKHLQKRIPWQSRQNKILVALAFSTKEAKELLYYIHQAFSGQTDYQIIIKGHYHGLPVQTLIKRLNLDFNKNTFIFSNEELDRLLPLVKAMIVASSSVALESITFGCPVIIPRLSGVIDMNPLSEISDLPLYAQSPERLRGLVDDILTRRESPVNYEKCKNFVENYFEFPDSEHELIEKIESCFAAAGKML